MECTAEKARRNTLLKHCLAAYSQSVLHAVIAEESIDYDRNDRGIIYFHRSQEALDRGVANMKLPEGDGQVIKVLDRAGVVALDPGLASVGEKIVGGIYCPTDEPPTPPNSPARSPRRSPGAAVQFIPAPRSPGSKPAATQSLRCRPTKALSRAMPMCSQSAPTARTWRAALASICRSIRSRILSDIPSATSRSRRRLPPSTSTILLPSRASATVFASPRRRSSPATTPVTSPRIFPSRHPRDAGSLSRRWRLRPRGDVGGAAADDTH